MKIKQFFCLVIVISLILATLPSNQLIAFMGLGTNIVKAGDIPYGGSCTSDSDCRQGYPKLVECKGGFLWFGTKLCCFEDETVKDGQCVPEQSSKLAWNQGDCDKDSDCASGLECKSSEGVLWSGEDLCCYPTDIVSNGNCVPATSQEKRENGQQCLQNSDCKDNCCSITNAGYVCISSAYLEANPNNYLRDCHGPYDNVKKETQSSAKTTCADACAAQSSSTFIYKGLCSPLESIPSAYFQQYGSISASKIGKKGQYTDCNSDQYCYCLGYQVSSGFDFSSHFSTSSPGSYGMGSAVISGTCPPSGNWKDDAALKNPPREQPGTLDCNIISNATLIADIDKQIVEAGKQVTITGTVNKLSSTCKGYIYTCRDYTSTGCDKSGWNIKPMPCPSGYNQLHSTCHGLGILGKGIINLVVTIIGGLIGFGIGKWIGAAIAATLAGSISNFATSMAILGKPMQEQNLTDFLNENYTSSANENMITGHSADSGGGSSSGGSSAGSSGGGITPEQSAALAMSQQIANQFNQMSAEIEAAKTPGYTICGHKYKLETCSAQPVCASGSYTGCVIGSKSCTYKCTESICGPYENKNIKIEIFDSDGNRLSTGTTQTDSLGEFSYTFNAPEVDDTLTIKVSVPDPTSG